MKKLLVVGLVIVCLFISGCGSNVEPEENYRTSRESLSIEDLYHEMNDDGYKYIDLSTDDGVGRAEYKKGDIILTKIDSLGYVKDYPKGESYYFLNTSISTKKVTLDGKGNKKQYKAYKKWLKEEGLTTEKVKELLDYVYDNAWKDVRR